MPTAPVTTFPPLRLKPRLDPKPWGGHRLANAGQPAAEPIGEALATADEATVDGGPFAGEQLGGVVAVAPTAVLGRLGSAAVGGQPRFPLLIKLIDAGQDLSIQVHPDDAAAPPGRLGKTEVYHVLAVAPGARIALGLRPGVDPGRFAAACRAGERTDSLLRWLPARPGETILIPAGTVHALGAGCMVYEAQQPSDVTYRLDDWGRLDAAGRPRETHVEPGLAVLAPALRPGPIPPLLLTTRAGQRQLLAACRHFALERIVLAVGQEVTLTAAGSPQAVTCLHGGAELASEAGTVPLAAGETGVLAAAIGVGRLRATTSAVLLRAWIPDLSAEIVAPARAAGHDDAAIAALAGPLPDVAAAMA